MSTFTGYAGHWDVWGKGQYVKGFSRNIYLGVFSTTSSITETECQFFVWHENAAKYISSNCTFFFFKIFNIYEMLFVLEFYGLSQIYTCRLRVVPLLIVISLSSQGGLKSKFLLIGWLFVFALYLMSTWLLGGLMSALRFSVYRKHRVFSNSCIYLSNSLYVFKEHLLVVFFCFFFVCFF